MVVGCHHFGTQSAVISYRAVYNIAEGAVIENYTVLENLNKGNSLMLLSRFEHFSHMLWINVIGSGNKGCSGCKSKLYRVDRFID